MSGGTARFLLSTIALLALLVGNASAATASPTPEALQPNDPHGQQCVEVAKARQIDSWACVGSTLLTAKGAEQLGPATRVRTEGTAVQDDYDYWCEAVSICDREVSNYIMETKANIYYGYGGSTVGTFDAVLRVNLSGRQPRHTVALIWDGGPGLYFERVEVNCYEELNNLPDRSCGNQVAGQGVFISGSGWRWTSAMIPGNWLANSNEYYSALSARWVPTGYPALVGRLFESPLFFCYGGDNCYFP